jgi:hypothetical protein
MLFVLSSIINTINATVNVVMIPTLILSVGFIVIDLLFILFD